MVGVCDAERRKGMAAHSFGVRKDALRRGEYKNYTFRLPMHLPEVCLSVVAERGCVCMYASNCSERPLPRMCQWTLLIDADKQRQGSLNVRTNEHHFVSGLYHVRSRCVERSMCSRASASGGARAPKTSAMWAIVCLLSFRMLVVCAGWPLLRGRREFLPWLLHHQRRSH